MSVQVDRSGWIVRWRDGSGRQRGQRFPSEDAARAFDAGLAEISPRDRRAVAANGAGGVYPYPTKRGTRWYFKTRDSAGRQTTKRGFTSARAARDAKRRLTEQVERGEVRHTRESFGQHLWRALQRAADATIWPTVSGGCHLARDTRLALEEGGFQIEHVERFGFRIGALDPPKTHLLGIARRI